MTADSDQTTVKIFGYSVIEDVLLISIHEYDEDFYVDEFKYHEDLSEFEYEIYNFY